ncbi:MAG: hypothetical protein MUF05_06585 [Candidatus Omnitrophica bacterium]|jgi:uncharacterized protein YpmB|nr:hypothetical protein [Candidatus Omnitrophota bacterium]
MFRRFHFYKFRLGKKGQLIPIFLVVLVVLITMSLVTMNLSKVAFFKTDTSNAADAGSLAGGSVMANVFNGVAQANSAMETGYWEFYALVAVSFAIATYNLIQAHTQAIAGQAAATAAEAAATAAVIAAGSAESTACPSPCAALGFTSAAIGKLAAAGFSIGKAIIAIGLALEAMEVFTTTLIAIFISVAAFAAAQIYFYASIRKMAKEGRESAIELAHKFAFMNSEIGSKLKAGKPASSVVGDDARNNYRDSFSDFLDNIKHGDEYEYRWVDGQERLHFVKTSVKLDKVDTFDLKVAALPSVVELPLLWNIISSAKAATASLTAAGASYASAEASWVAAGVSYTIAEDALVLACACVGPCLSCCHSHCHAGCPCCHTWATQCAAAEAALFAGIETNFAGLKMNALGLESNAAAIATMASMYAPLAIALAGLLPAYPVRSGNLESSFPFIICWIDDIVHDRLVTLRTTQHHQGGDLGLWQTEYPDITSYSVVNFTGLGQIHEPVLRHDASIVETDDPGVTYNRCKSVVEDVSALEGQVVDLYQNAATMESQASETEVEANALLVAGLIEQANALFASADLLRDNADGFRQNAADIETQIKELRTANADCF